MIQLALSAAWLAGLGIAAAGHPGAALMALPLGVGACAGFALERRPALPALTLACLALLLAGSARFQASEPPASPTGIALFNAGPTVHLRGTVVGEPEERGATQRYVVAAAEVLDGGAWHGTSGRVLVTARPFPRLNYGDYLELRGRLETPPSFESFDYREHLARRGIVSLLAFPRAERLASGRANDFESAVIGLRDRLGASLADALPEPEAALARGMLLGQRASISPALTGDFNRAGISHLIAISGSNVTLVAGLALALFTWLMGRRRAVVAAMIFVLGFVVLVGASPPVLRAGIMGIVMLGAILAGRPGSALTAVAFAAAVLTALEPLAVLDVAFQLSFAAAVGLIVLAPRISGRLQPALGRLLPAAAATWLAESLSITTAATLAVFPITAANFERVSLAAVPANIVAVPLFGATIITSAATAVAGLISADLGATAGRVAEVPLWALIGVARAFSSIPGSAIDVHGLGLETAAFLYLALALVLLRRPRAVVPASPRRALVRFPLAATALLLSAAAFAWAGVLIPGDGRLRVSILDVGQGDAILIKTPSGQRILIDGGPDGAALVEALSKELPSGDRRIDLVILTHPQEDHVAGLVSVSERFDVRRAAITASTSTIASYRAWLDRLASDGTPILSPRPGEVAALGDGVLLQVLAPPEPRLTGTVDDLNNNSLVLRLTYGDVSFLLAGDLAEDGERALLNARGDLRATVLKVGHHGSDGSSSPEFITAVRPSAAVISTGANNSFGHPSPTTLLALAGVPVYRTDRNGSVRFETDGRRLFASAERGSYQLVPVSATR